MSGLRKEATTSNEAYSDLTVIRDGRTIWHRRSPVTISPHSEGVAVATATATTGIPRPRVAPSQEQFAATLTFKQRMLKVRDGIYAAPRKLKGWLTEAARSVMNSGPMQWVKRGWLAGKRHVMRAINALGPVGSTAAALWAAASKNGQKVIKAVSGGVWSAAKWVGNTAVKGVSKFLRWFGKPGTWLAEKVEKTRDWVGDRLREVRDSKLMNKLRTNLSYKSKGAEVARGTGRMIAVATAVMRFVPGAWQIPALLVGLAASLPSRIRNWFTGKAKQLGKHLKVTKPDLKVVPDETTVDPVSEVLEGELIDGVVQVNVGPTLNGTPVMDAIEQLRAECCERVLDASHEFFFTREKAYTTSDAAHSALTQKAQPGFSVVIKSKTPATNAAKRFATAALAKWGWQQLPPDLDDDNWAIGVALLIKDALDGQLASSGR